MKKFLAIIMALTLGLLSACGGSSASSGAQSAAQSALATDTMFSVVTTIFPEYDWVRNILGDRADRFQVTMLLDSGVDLHSYQPTADDMIKISTCDLFLYVGGESDRWVDDALKEAVNQNMIVLDLMDILGDTVKEEEIVEGMEEDHEEAERDHEEEPEYDEHIWLSLRNASALCDTICDAVSKVDPAGADTYAANCQAYRQKLQTLDQQYAQMAEGAARKTLLFGDRFPFRYLTDDYGLDYYAAFAGCSAETEASFETVAFLAGKLDELELPVVLTLENSDHKIAETIIQTAQHSSAEILEMDSMQSVTKEDVSAGASYLQLMEKNLAALEKALS